jgi:hypothetical protein
VVGKSCIAGLRHGGLELDPSGDDQWQQLSGLRSNVCRRPKQLHRPEPCKLALPRPDALVKWGGEVSGAAAGRVVDVVGSSSTLEGSRVEGQWTTAGTT